MLFFCVVFSVFLIVDFCLLFLFFFFFKQKPATRFPLCVVGPGMVIRERLLPPFWERPWAWVALGQRGGGSYNYNQHLERGLELGESRGQGGGVQKNRAGLLGGAWGLLWYLKNT